MGTAFAQTPSRSAGRSLAVSVPAEPPMVRPGEVSSIPIRVVNPGDAPVVVRITGRAVRFGDNGKVTLTDAPDPMWSNRVTFPSGRLTIPAQSYRDLKLTVRMPDPIDPDLYFVGFLVSPVPQQNGRVAVVNEIGSFITLDVPGPRVRLLRAGMDIDPTVIGGVRIPWFVVGTEAHGSMEVTNAGRSQVQYWGEIDGSTWPGGAPAQTRLDRSLLPIGREKTYRLSTAHVWLIGMATVRSIIVYPKVNDQSTTQIVLVRHVLVVTPWLIAAVAIAIALLVWRVVRRRRRRRRRAREKPARTNGEPRDTRRAGALVEP